MLLSLIYCVLLEMYWTSLSVSSGIVNKSQPSDPKPSEPNPKPNYKKNKKISKKRLLNFASKRYMQEGREKHMEYTVILPDDADRDNPLKKNRRGRDTQNPWKGN
jgi:hypothetical protein